MYQHIVTTGLCWVRHLDISVGSCGFKLVLKYSYYHVWPYINTQYNHNIMHVVGAQEVHVDLMINLLTG